MRYISTRSGVTPTDFRSAVLTGQTPDGGLFLPNQYPTIPPFPLENFQQFSAGVMAPFAPEIDFQEILGKAWKTFKPKITPLDENLYLLELFHGPTLSFKDFGLQFLSQILDKFSKDPIKIIGATSGDTGAAAVHALKNKEKISLYMLHPKGRISDLQRRQMTTVRAPNIHNLAIEGSFDDCQRLMKTILSDPELGPQFTTINSINWGRILAQTTYYWWASEFLKGDYPCHFVVPSGNFGNAFSGYVAMRSGAKISGVTIATNSNDILPRTFETGVYKPGQAIPTLSPAMDIQVANNFERVLFEESGRDSDFIKRCLSTLADTGSYKIPDQVFKRLKTFFSAERASEEETKKAIDIAYKSLETVLDPHTAVGFAVLKKEKVPPKGSVVLLGTAHPGKFPESIPHQYLKSQTLPASLSSLMEAKENYRTMKADEDLLKKFIKNDR